MSSKYVQVYNTLKKQIESGEYAIGEEFPSEGELQSRFQVSRDTVRKSLGMLENQGYIRKSRGRVAVVVERGEGNFPFAEILSFKELNAQLKRKTETEVENLEILSDPELTAIQAYDVWHEKKMCGKVSMGVVRTTYVIDENGVIEWAKEKVKPDVNAGELLDYLG